MPQTSATQAGILGTLLVPRYYSCGALSLWPALGFKPRFLQCVQSAPAWLASPLSPGDEDVEGPCNLELPSHLADTCTSCAPSRALQESSR